MKRSLFFALVLLAFAPLALLIVTCSEDGLAQTKPKPRPKPLPTPRRPLVKPLDTARNFDQFAKRDASARLIAGAATRGTGQAKFFYEEGEAAYEAGNYQKAVADFSESVRLDPVFTDAHFALGVSLIELNKLEAAINEFKQVIKLKAGYDLMVKSHYNLGNVYFDLGKYQEAIDAYQESIALNPELSKPRNNLGLAYAAVNRVSEAIAEFSEAVLLKPDYAEAHYNLGVASFQLGKTADARKQEQILAKLKPDLAQKLAALIKE